MRDLTYKELACSIMHTLWEIKFQKRRIKAQFFVVADIVTQIMGFGYISVQVYDILLNYGIAVL